VNNDNEIKTYLNKKKENIGYNEKKDIIFLREKDEINGSTPSGKNSINTREFDSSQELGLEIKEKELQQAKARSEREKEEAAKWFKEQEEQRNRSVPLPAELRNLLKNIPTN
jgi:ArsR family metal-binding transcriptional regulator